MQSICQNTTKTQISYKSAVGKDLQHFTFSIDVFTKLKNDKICHAKMLFLVGSLQYQGLRD